VTALCGNPMPGAREGIEPCPLDQGHEEEHIYFVQTAKPGEKRKRNGVWIYAESGKALMHMTFMGYVQPEEVGVMATYLQWAAKEGKST
jgi:hypothetical protein